MPPKGEDQRTKTTYPISPNACRLRDMTYAGRILVDIKYMKGKTPTFKRNVEIGYMPIMLKSSKCILAGQTPDNIAKLGECPLDPGR